MPTELRRFVDCMEYAPSERRPNHELGVWPQTRARWLEEAPDAVAGFTWDWFVGEPALGFDEREYVDVNYSFMPAFDAEVLAESDEYEVIRNPLGIVTKALKPGTVDGGRACMDQYLSFPVSNRDDFRDIKRRLVAALPERYPQKLAGQAQRWQTREVPLVLGRNCAIKGFYWRAREWMGTEALSYAFYEQPALVHEMMEFFADFIAPCGDWT